MFTNIFKRFVDVENTFKNVDYEFAHCPKKSFMWIYFILFLICAYIGFKCPEVMFKRPSIYKLACSIQNGIL